MNCVTSSDYTLVTVYPSTYYITHRSLVMLFLHLKTSTAVITLWTPILNACGSLNKCCLKEIGLLKHFISRKSEKFGKIEMMFHKRHLTFMLQLQ